MADKSSYDVFWGGILLNSCSPLEINLNACGLCYYCFADLNKPHRTVNLVQIRNQFEQFRDRRTLAAHLMRQGYPTVLSNKVDPFSPSNADISYWLIEQFQFHGIPFSLQSKCGDRAMKALDMIEQPIVFYLSLAHWNEDQRRMVEPGAPSIEKRLEFMEAAIAKGHKICVGINPCVESWLPLEDANHLCQALANVGVWGVWVQSLHLSNKQLKRMPDINRQSMGEVVIAEARQPKKYPRVHRHTAAVRAIAEEWGLHTHDNQQGTYSRYFEPYREIYPQTYPLMQDWVNFAHENYTPGQILTIKDWLDFFVPHFPVGEWSLRDHFNAICIPQQLYGKWIPQRMTYEELLTHAWLHKETVICPANTECFGWVGERIQGDEWVQFTDDAGMPLLTFQPQGCKEAFFDIGREREVEA